MNFDILRYRSLYIQHIYRIIGERKRRKKKRPPCSERSSMRCYNTYFAVIYLIFRSVTGLRYFFTTSAIPNGAPLNVTVTESEFLTSITV